MENTGSRRRQYTAIYPVFALFNPQYNGHFYEATKHSDCHCVIDGSAAPHVLWELGSHWKLSNEAQLAVIVENFFKSLLRAKITPHVLFLRPARDVFTLQCFQYATLEERVRDMNSSDWKETSSMQSRIIFSEVIKTLGIHHCFAVGAHASIAAYAKSIDAFVISGNNFFFLADVPRGYVLLKQLLDTTIKQLRYGLIDIIAPTYFRKKFLNNLRCVEIDKMKSIALFATLVSPLNEELLKEFKRARILKPGARIHGINLSRFNAFHRYLAQLLLFVTDKSFEDARLTILSHMYPDKRQEFESIYEQNYLTFDSAAYFPCECSSIVPKLTDYLEFEMLLEDESSDSESSDDEECLEGGSDHEEGSEEGSDDDFATDKLLPGWFKETVQSETFGGYWGNKLQSMVALMATGCFFPLHHLQDLSDYSACFASLRVRRVLYGIMFQDFRKQLQEEEALDAFNAFRIKEYAVIRTKLCELRVEPTWSVTDTKEPRETMELPGLLEMENLDLATRKRIFAVAMVGSSGWLDTLGHDVHKHEYNLLLLRSWAKRSPNLEKIHVIVLLLTILAIEAKYSKKTLFFPWSISFREGVVLECLPLTAVIRYKCLQPFAQLQSTTDIACYLNSALASPHGLRVDSVREFYSEVFFHDLLADWSRVSETERAERLSSLFEDECLEKFSSFVDALYGDEDEPERAPLHSVLSEEGFSNDEILGRVRRIVELDSSDSEISEDEISLE